MKAFPLPPCRALPVADQAAAVLEGAPSLVAAPVCAVPAAFVPAAFWMLMLFSLLLSLLLFLLLLLLFGLLPLSLMLLSGSAFVWDILLGRRNCRLNSPPHHLNPLVRTTGGFLWYYFSGLLRSCWLRRRCQVLTWTQIRQVSDGTTSSTVRTAGLNDNKDVSAAASDDVGDLIKL